MREISVGFLPEALVLGFPELDGQHAGLFALLAQLKAQCLESGRLAAEQADKLLLKLQEHFATEERLAGEALIYFAEHARKHRDMLAALAKAFDEVRAGGRDVFSLLRFIEYWFERHIGESDRHLTARLQARSREQAAAQQRQAEAA